MNNDNFITECMAWITVFCVVGLLVYMGVEAADKEAAMYEHRAAIHLGGGQ